jgi:hypothetical protein
VTLGVAALCGLGGGVRGKAALAAVGGGAAAAGAAHCALLAALSPTPQAATMGFSLTSFLAVAVAGYLVKRPNLPRYPVSRKPRENPGFSDFGGPYFGQFEADSAPSWTVDHLCTSSRDLDTKVARIDSYKVMLKRR